MKPKYLFVSLIVIGLALVMASCAGTQGPAGPAGPAGRTGPAGPAGPAGSDALVAGEVPLETCTTCHKDSGANHQDAYNEMYQDGVITVSGLTYAFTAPNTHTVTFTMAKEGAPFMATQADSLAIYFAPWDGEAFQFDPALERVNLKGKITCDAAAKCTSVLTADDEIYKTNFRSVDGLVVLYGRDETIKRLPARVDQNKYPFAALLETGAGVDYVSAANNDGCELCHTDPYLKHGYIYGQVDLDPATDFYTCKACHLDNGEGGHFEWQLLVDNPELAAQFLADETVLTDAMKEQYAYTTSVMNDVHMSHAMEFPYPQSMATCNTCHAGKLDMVLADEKFTIDTCKSCHPMTGAVKVEGEETIFDTTTLALKTIIPEGIHGSMDWETTDCTSCHKVDGTAPAFNAIHTGYDKAIYTADGVRISDVVKVTIDEATVADNKVTFKFSAVEETDLEGIDVANIVPTVMVGLYGWDTKDFIVGAHERLIDDNGDGKINGDDSRTLEFTVGEEHPRGTTVSAEGGVWEVTADFSTWADLVADGTVKRIEMAVMPELVVDDVTLALDAPSRTFDLSANDFADGYYKPIVDVEKCQTCHDALATNYHSADRGGSVVVCRMCHITKAGGSHLEMQSRSIDSYAHAIHSFQVFDLGNVNFANPVEALEVEHHINFPYPTHGVTNCESCHIKGMYEAPDQGKSLPGILSASSDNDTLVRDIAGVPAMITGPATRACGGCHRAALINEDAAGGLMVFSKHIQQGGYMIEAGEDPQGTLRTVIDQVMELFK